MSAPQQSFAKSAMLKAWRWTRSLTGNAPRRLVVNPTSDSGSLGDQAMADAVCRYCSEQLRMEIITTGRPDRAIGVRAPALFADFNKRRALRNIPVLFRMLRASHMVYLGADVLDGTYSGDCRRLARIDAASRAGLSCAVLGFSFSDVPAPAAIARIKSLPAMPMHVRDAVSLRRFEAATGRPGVLVADLAFLLKPEATSANILAAIDWIAARRATGGTVLGVNAGGPGLWKGATVTLPALEQTLRTWLDTDAARSIVFVPHDFRAGKVGDIEAIDALAEALAAFGPDRIHVLRGPFDAWEVKALAGQIDFALTARMHFAIACLGMGVPPLCMAYQGKFEGLMQHFELTGTLIEPDRSLLEQLDLFQGRLPELRAQIAARLPEVRRRSEANFTWIGLAKGSLHSTGTKAPVPLNPE